MPGPEAFLRQFLEYNAKLLGVANDPATRRNPLHAVAARLKPVAPLAGPKPGDSWLGGSPHLPDPFVWPRTDGKPLHFLGQIACSALPADIWGGLGPTKGYVAFFVGMNERVEAAVVHAADLGPQRQAPEPWPDAFLPSSARRSGFARSYDAIPAWRVEISPLREGDADPRKSWKKNANRFPDVDLSRPEFQPHDGASLRLLLNCALDVERRRASRYREDLAGAEARLGNGGPDVELWKRIAAEAVALRSRVAEVVATRPFRTEFWRPFALQAAAWKQAALADRLRVSRDLWFTGYQHLSESAGALLAVGARVLPRHPRLNLTLTSIWERSRKLCAPDGEMRRHLDQIDDGKARWHDLHRRFPDYWRRAAQDIEKMGATLYDAEVELRLAEGPNLDADKPAPLWAPALPFQNAFPVSGDQAQKFANNYVETAQRWLAEAEKFGNAERELNQRVGPMLEAAEAQVENRAAELARAAGPFDVAQWLGTLARLQEDEAMKRALSAYEAQRYRLAAFDYARDPDGLPPAVRAHFEARWANDGAYEIAAMGGLPEGWSYDMMDGVDSRVMLLELPSSVLLGWQWGDVNGLAISVAAEDLGRGVFRNARAEITN